MLAVGLCFMLSIGKMRAVCLCFMLYIGAAAALTPSAAHLARVHSTARIAHVHLAQRSKEELENMEKWGRILSQADTFDERFANKRTPQAAAEAKANAKRAELSLAVGGAAVIVAMIVATLAQR